MENKRFKGKSVFLEKKLERLRKEIWALEKELKRYGFDEKKGLEVYERNELKEMLKIFSDEEKERVMSLLRRLLKVQLRLYRTYDELLGLDKNGGKRTKESRFVENKIEKINAWLEKEGISET
jgi:hypothetical protein